MKAAWDVKALSVILLLGIPLMGLYLFWLGATWSDDILMGIAIVMILIFPAVLSINVLRAKTIR